MRPSLPGVTVTSPLNAESGRERVQRSDGLRRWVCAVYLGVLRRFALRGAVMLAFVVTLWWLSVAVAVVLE